MEQILQSLNLGTLRGRFEAQRIEPQAVLNLMRNFEKFWEKILKKNSGKKFEKKFGKKFWQKILKKIWEKILKKILEKILKKNLGNS